MTLDSSTGKWIIAFIFGALMIGLYSWSRFDEPSYDSQSEYFARYKPRFSTSYMRYARARLAYLGAMLLIYAIFSLVPELFAAIASIGAGADRTKAVDGLKTVDGLIPLAVTVGVLTLQNVPGLKEVERRIRGSLHSVARIPDCVRRTVAQMRSSPFAFDKNDYDSQTKKLDLPPDIKTQLSGSLNKLTDEDVILHTWYSVGCVQSWLRKSGQDDRWSFCLTAGTLCPTNQEKS